MKLCGNGGIVLTEENRIIRRKTRPIATSILTNLTWKVTVRHLGTAL